VEARTLLHDKCGNPSPLVQPRPPSTDSMPALRYQSETEAFSASHMRCLNLKLQCLRSRKLSVCTNSLCSSNDDAGGEKEGNLLALNQCLSALREYTSQSDLALYGSELQALLFRVEIQIRPRYGGFEKRQCQRRLAFFVKASSTACRNHR
jgi:hypothetical protein